MHRMLSRCLLMLWIYMNFTNVRERTWIIDGEQNVKRRSDLLDDGLSVGDVSQHHALDDAVVLLLRQVLVRHQRSVVLGGRGGVDTLQPGVALDLFQRGSSLRLPLEHPVYQTGQKKKTRSEISDLQKITLLLGLQDLSETFTEFSINSNISSTFHKTSRQCQHKLNSRTNNILQRRKP